MPYQTYGGVLAVFVERLVISSLTGVLTVAVDWSSATGTAVFTVLVDFLEGTGDFGTNDALTEIDLALTVECFGFSDSTVGFLAVTVLLAPATTVLYPSTSAAVKECLIADFVSLCN
jgi:hypothetical protein